MSWNDSGEKVEITGDDKSFNIGVKSVFKRINYQFTSSKNPK
jgi:hypothetical protein